MGGLNSREPAASTARTSFEQDRLRPELYEDLRNPQASVKFLRMVRDYMEHVRSLNEDSFGHEQDAMGKFLTLINNDVGWTLARTVVPEFRQTITTLEQFPGPLRAILKDIKFRTLPIPTREECLPEYERELVWKRVRSQIDYLFWASETGMDPGEAAVRRQAEVDDLATRLVYTMSQTGLKKEDLLGESEEA